MARKPTKPPARTARGKAATPVREHNRTTKSKATAEDSVNTTAKDTRFKPGQSGNPRGRPRKDRNLLKHIEAELDAEMQVTEGGKTMRLTKREALAKSMVNKALQGDPKMLTALLKYLPKPKGDESQEQYSVRLDTLLRLFARKGPSVSEVAPDPDESDELDPGDDQ